MGGGAWILIARSAGTPALGQRVSQGRDAVRSDRLTPQVRPGVTGQPLCVDVLLPQYV